jgi:hypothetical protein
MRNPYIAAAALLLVSLGCMDDGDEAKRQRQGPSQRAFCEELAEKACAAHERCCTDPEYKTDACFESAHSYCLQWVDYAEEEAGVVVRSHVEYRADLAAELLDAAEPAFAECEPVSLDLGGVFFAPRLSLGDRCLFSDGCPRGTYCSADGTSDQGTCRAPPDEEGASCAAVDGRSQCTGGLTCGPDDRCMKPLVLGESCQRSEHCASGICSDDEVCAECTPRSDACSGDACALWCSHELVCDGSACAVPVPGSRKTGEACESNVQCTSGVCHGECLPEGTPPDTNQYCEPDLLVRPLWT